MCIVFVQFCAWHGHLRRWCTACFASPRKRRGASSIMPILCREGALAAKSAFEPCATKMRGPCFPLASRVWHGTSLLEHMSWEVAETRSSAKFASLWNAVGSSSSRGLSQRAFGAPKSWMSEHADCSWFASALWWPFAIMARYIASCASFAFRRALESRWPLLVTRP